MEPWELYDLKTDRAEQKDLAAKMSEKVKELSDLWQKQTDAFAAAVKQPPAKGKDMKDKKDE
jgi:arylsulfatase